MATPKEIKEHSIKILEAALKDFKQIDDTLFDIGYPCIRVRSKDDEGNRIVFIVGVEIIEDGE